MSESNSPVAAAVNAVRQSDTVVEAPATPAVAQPADPKLDMYARKERQLQQARRKFEAEQQAFRAKQAGYETDYVPKSKLASDPVAALAEAGVSYDQLTEMLLNQPDQSNPAIKQMLAKIRALEEKQTAAERAAAQATEQQFEQAKKQIDTEAKLLIDSDPEFETIKAKGLHEAVTELIVETYQSEGFLMDVREAALEVENHLIEEAIQLASLSKVQSRLKPATPEPAAVTAGQPQQSQALKTLTNAVTNSSAPKRLSEKDRIARAMAAFKGELK